MAAKDPAKPKRSRLAQVRSTYSMARQVDPRIGWITLGVFVAVLAVAVLLGLLLGSWLLGLLFGLPLAALAAMVVFGRRTQKAAYARMQGQPGAAAAALGTLRRGWSVTPNVAITRNQDVAHRVVGRPGVVLVGEGAPSRVRHLLAQETRRHARVAGDAPVYSVVTGDGEGQVPLRRLQRHVMGLPRNLRPAQVTELNHRLRALGNSQLPVPKGPLPRNVKVPRGGGLPRR